MLDYFIRFYIQMEFGVTLILTDVIFCICCVLALNDIARKPTLVLIRCAEVVVLWILLVFGSSILFFLSGRNTYNFIVNILLTILYVSLCSKYRWSVKISLGFVYIAAFLAIWSVSESAGFLFRYYVVGEHSPFDLTLIIQVLFMGSLVWFLKATPLNRFSVVPWHFSSLVCSIAAVYIFFSQYLAILYGTLRGVILPINLGFLFLVLGAYRLLFMFTREHAEKMDMQALYMRSEKDRELIMMAHENIERMHTLRHDLKNHYSYMELMIKQKEYDKLEAYFKKYSTEFFRYSEFQQLR